ASDNTLTTQTSDRSLKTNLRPLNNVLDSVLAIETYNFNWIDNPNGPQDVGFIAQEIAEIFPELAFTNPTDGKMGVRYSLMTTYLTQAIQEQQDIIVENRSSLDSRIDYLDNEIYNLGVGVTEANTNVYELNDTLFSTSSELQTIRNEVQELRNLIEADNQFIEETTESSETTESTQSTPLDSPDSILEIVTTTFENFKTLIADLGLSSTEQGELLVSSDLIVLGETTLSDVNVTGNFTAGLVEIDALNSSIQTVGTACYNPESGSVNSDLCEVQTLYLQKNLAGNVDLFNGKVIIEPTGDLTIDGTLYAEKVETLGYALNEESTLVGSSSIIAGETEVTIENASIEETSKVFVTPTTATSGQVLVVLDKVNNESFTVAIEEAIETDIEFDWWILDITSTEIATEQNTEQ
ncbi:tail fiber domain-containing protein, partial [Patescibacteria group bacterium]